MKNIHPSRVEIVTEKTLQRKGNLLSPPGQEKTRKEKPGRNCTERMRGHALPRRQNSQIEFPPYSQRPEVGVCENLMAIGLGN